jgi:predicted phosphoribosyltransferase
MADTNDKFLDRREAGRQLANALARFAESEPLILALPRSGVPVAFEVAKALQAPLDLLIVRKIGAPGHEELALAPWSTATIRKSCSIWKPWASLIQRRATSKPKRNGRPLFGALR